MSQLTPDELRSLLGKVFIQTHCYRAPDVYIVTGWTKNAVNLASKKRTVRIQDVPAKFITLTNHIDGGDWLLNDTLADYAGQIVKSNSGTTKYVYKCEDTVMIKVGSLSDDYAFPVDLTIPNRGAWCTY